VLLIEPEAIGEPVGKAICQLKNCSSSEVAAMIEGLLWHCADA
jgi:TnpA family transposase